MTLLLFSLGILALIGAGIAWVRRGQFMAYAVEAKGKVVGHVSSNVSRPSSPGTAGPTDSFEGRTGSSSPIVEFQTPSGKVIRFTSGLSSFEAGEDITVLYLPDNPNRAEVKNSFAQTGWILIVAALGVALCGAGLLLRSFPSSGGFDPFRK